MSLSTYKITDTDLLNVGVSRLTLRPNDPISSAGSGMSGAQLKTAFDSYCKLIKDRLNLALTYLTTLDYTKEIILPAYPNFNNVTNLNDVVSKINGWITALDSAIKGNTAKITADINTHNSDLNAHNDILIAHNGDNNAHSTKFNSKANLSELNGLVKDVSVNESTGEFTFTKYDNTTKVINTIIESIITSGEYNESTQKLVFTLKSGQTLEIPASAITGDYTGLETATTQVIVNSGNQISVNVKGDSITETLLAPAVKDKLSKIDLIPEDNVNSVAAYSAEGSFVNIPNTNSGYIDKCTIYGKSYVENNVIKDNLGYKLISCGKNILPTIVDNWEIGGLLFATGALHTTTTRLRLKDYIPINPNIQLTCSTITNYAIVVFFYKTDNTFISCTTADLTQVTITTPANTAKLKAIVYKKPEITETVNNITNIKPQIEIGSSVTPFEAYQGSTQNFTVALRSAGIVKDAHNTITGKADRNVVRYTFTGNENFTIYGTEAEHISFMINSLNLGSKKQSSADSIEWVSAPLTAQSQTYCLANKNSEWCFRNFGTEFFVFSILKSKLATADVAGFKAWVTAQNTAGTPLSINAAKETPTSETVAPVSIPTYAGQTNMAIVPDAGSSTPTFNILEFNTGANKDLSMLKGPDGRVKIPYTEGEAVTITEGEYKGKNVNYIINELLNRIKILETP